MCEVGWRGAGSGGGGGGFCKLEGEKKISLLAVTLLLGQ